MSKLLQIYLRFWAKRYLVRVKPQIIAITGSVGKTSTKEAIFEVLQAKFGKEVRKSSGNLNTETGVPLAILDFKEAPSRWFEWFPIVFAAPFVVGANSDTKFLVLEMAADKPGDITYLTGFVKPNIAVLTSIGPSHLAAFGTVEKIAEEKTALLRALPSDGWAVINADNELTRKASYGGRWQKKTFGVEENADYRASDIKMEIENFRGETHFNINFDGKKAPVLQNTLGKPFVYASLAAFAVGKILQESDENILGGIKRIKAEKHRMNIFAGLAQSTVIDDSYNANPASMKAALETLKVLPAPKKGRKIAVLGDMREIGKISDEAHKLIGEYSKQVADLTISIGKLAKKYNSDKHFIDAESAGQYLLNELREDDIILIKASRAIGLDKIADMLKTEIKTLE